MNKKSKPSVAVLVTCMLSIVSACSPFSQAATPTASSTSVPTLTRTATPTKTATPTATPTLDPCYDENPYNGWLYHETCIPGVVSEGFWLSPNPHNFVGIATYYGDGIMEKVAANRGLSLNGYRGGVALMLCGDIGASVWLKRGPQYEYEGPYLVVDCSAREHIYYNVAVAGIAVEVDAQTANRWGMSGGLGGVAVCKGNNCQRGSTLLKSWFLQNVTWEAPPNEKVPDS